MPLAESLPTTDSHSKTPIAPNQSSNVPLWRCGVLLFLTFVLLALSWIKPPPSAPAQAGVAMTLPSWVKLALPNNPSVTFHGFNQPMSEGELGELPQDTKFARKEYDDFEGHNRIVCTIVLSGAEQRSIHRPEACLPGQGWNIVGQTDVPVRLASGRTLVVRNLAIEHANFAADSNRQVVRGYYMYWFVGENVTTPSHYRRIFLTSWDRVMHNRAHRWAYVSVLATITNSLRPNGLDAEQTRTMLTDFIRQAVPAFQKNEMAEQNP